MSFRTKPDRFLSDTTRETCQVFRLNLKMPVECRLAIDGMSFKSIIPTTRINMVGQKPFIANQGFFNSFNPQLKYLECLFRTKPARFLSNTTRETCQVFST